jgi:uncharacterized protein
VLVSVKVHPGASREALALRVDGSLEAWVRPPPSDGKANQALLQLLAERLRLPRGAVELRRGAASRQKLVELPLAGLAELRRRLDAAGQ